jgi:transcriptional regulator with XRE-family HTH domain
MLRGVRLDGNFIRHQRTQNGMSQKMLADAAGISERTVRNAEKGLVVEVHIASYLSALFDVPLGDMVLERLEEQRSKWLQKWARKFSYAYVTSRNDNHHDDLFPLLHPAIHWRCNSAPKMKIDGSLDGRPAIMEWLQGHHCPSEPQQISIVNERIERVEAEVDILYFILAADWVMNDNGGSKRSAWITFLCRFEDDLAITIEQFNGVSF